MPDGRLKSRTFVQVAMGVTSLGICGVETVRSGRGFILRIRKVDVRSTIPCSIS
jgi:hypothetical protein